MSQVKSEEVPRLRLFGSLPPFPYILLNKALIVCQGTPSVFFKESFYH
jgi:hypothetical protein